MSKKLLVIKPPFQAFPIGIAYVLSCLERNNIQFDFIDTSLNYLDLRKNLRHDDYLAVATGGLIGQLDFFHDVVRQARTTRPELPIILGGNIVKDIKADFLFDKIGVDYGIVGEAETSLPYLVDAISKGSDDYKDIPGLVFKNKLDGKVTKNAPRRLELTSANILPSWHHFDIDYYSKEYYLPYWGIQSAMPVLTGRGCVGRCSFCSPTIGSFQPRPIEHVIEEIEFLNSTYDFEWIVFFNEMFYPSKEGILNFCRAYQKVKLKKPWVCGMRVDANPGVETFIAMKEAGCLSASAGIESGSDKVLKLMRKRTTAEQVKKFFRDAREAELPCNGTFMVANEGETEEDLRQTIDMVISEEMNTGESLTLLYPGTLIYRNALERGLIEDEWEYLRQLRFTTGVWETEWADRKYINISEIPNECFWDVIVSELRRYHTFLLHRFQAKDMEYKTVAGIEHLEISGLCSECDHRVVVYSQHKLLGIEDYCPKCFNKVVFNLYKLKDFAVHFEWLCIELRRADRLVILGTNYNAFNILRIDYFGLNYDRIIGFLEIKQQQATSSTFIHMPRLQIEDLSNARPDTILIVDDPGRDAELQLRLFYSRERLQPPRIMHLIPDTKRLGSKITRLVDRLDNEQGAAIAYKAILVFMIPVLRFRMIILDSVNLLGRLRRMGPRKAAKKLIRKVTYLRSRRFL